MANYALTSKNERDWLKIRLQYETGTMSQRSLADSLGIPRNTVMQRAIREKWVQRSKLVRKSALAIDARLNASIQRKVEAELAPWIETEKTKWTKRGHKLAAKGVSRAERYFKRVPVADARDEANIAKAAETYHRIGRVALGMSDGSPVSGSVNLNILTNQAAIAVAPDSSQD